MGAIAAAMEGRGPPPQETVAAMLAASPHRGSDHRILVVGPVALAVSNDPARIDASIVASRGRAAAFAGALDNRGELAKELELAPVEPNPAEVLLEAFERWGESAVARLRGAFAGVVFDGSRLWCFRDHLGYKPLFYQTHGDTFFVGTEAKQVAAGTGIPRRANREIVAEMYYRGAQRESALSGIRRFMAGELGALAPGGDVTTRRYWDPTHLVESLDIGVVEAAEQLVEMFQVAVTRTITGEDAVTLSGGIDSTTIAAFGAPEHARVAGRPLVGITTIFPHHPATDESEASSAVAAYLQIPLRQLVLERGVLEDVEDHVALADGPWDSLPMPHVLEVYEAAKSAGARTVLAGDLAEYVYTLTYSLLGHLLLRGRFGGLRTHVAALHDDGLTWPRIARRVLKEVTPEPVGKLFYRLARKRTARYPAWVNVKVVGESSYRNDTRGPVLKRWRELQVGATRDTSTTLEANEICAARAGVEVRRPLTDVDLWEFFLSLRAEVKFPDPVDKSLVRTAMRGRLPDRILDNRVKTVFDDHVVAAGDFERLARWVDDRDFRMPGVDYGLLRERIATRSMAPTELVWAYDLARAHAFVSRFG